MIFSAFPKTNIIIFFVGLIIGLVLFYLFSRYYYYKDVIEKKSCVKILNDSSDGTVPGIINCVNHEEVINATSSKPKKNPLEIPSSYLLQINDKNTDYYEVSVTDEKDNILWVKNNISQVDLSTFGQKKVKYKIFDPATRSVITGTTSKKLDLPHNIYKVPKLSTTFNPSSVNTKKLKCYTDTEIDYQEALVDKILESSDLAAKKEIKGQELKSYEGVLSRCSVIFISEIDLFDIKTKEISRSFLVYPSNGILTDVNNITFKEDLHESFGMKITEVVIEENSENCNRVSVIFPLINYKSSLPTFKLIFI